MMILNSYYLLLLIVSYFLSNFSDSEYKFKVERSNFFPQPNVSKFSMLWHQFFFKICISTSTVNMFVLIIIVIVAASVSLEVCVVF